MKIRLFKTVFGLFALPYAETKQSTTEKGSEPKLYHNATIDDEFADNRILIVMNHETSSEMKDFSAVDFKEVNATKVNEITQHSKAILKEKDAVSGKGALNVLQRNHRRLFPGGSKDHSLHQYSLLYRLIKNSYSFERF